MLALQQRCPHQLGGIKIPDSYTSLQSFCGGKFSLRRVQGAPLSSLRDEESQDPGSDLSCSYCDRAKTRIRACLRNANVSPPSEPWQPSAALRPQQSLLVRLGILPYGACILSNSS